MKIWRTFLSVSLFILALAPGQSRCQEFPFQHRCEYLHKAQARSLCEGGCVSSMGVLNFFLGTVSLGLSSSGVFQRNLMWQASCPNLLWTPDTSDLEEIQKILHNFTEVPKVLIDSFFVLKWGITQVFQTGRVQTAATKWSPKSTVLILQPLLCFYRIPALLGVFSSKDWAGCQRKDWGNWLSETHFSSSLFLLNCTFLIPFSCCWGFPSPSVLRIPFPLSYPLPYLSWWQLSHSLMLLFASKAACFSLHSATSLSINVGINCSI